VNERYDVRDIHVGEVYPLQRRQVGVTEDELKDRLGDVDVSLDGETREAWDVPEGVWVDVAKAAVGEVDVAGDLVVPGLHHVEGIGLH